MELQVSRIGVVVTPETLNYKLRKLLHSLGECKHTYQQTFGSHVNRASGHVAHALHGNLKHVATKAKMCT